MFDSFSDKKDNILNRKDNISSKNDNILNRRDNISNKKDHFSNKNDNILNKKDNYSNKKDSFSNRKERFPSEKVTLENVELESVSMDLDPEVFGERVRMMTGKRWTVRYRNMLVAEQSPLAPKICGSNPVDGNFISQSSI